MDSRLPRFLTGRHVKPNTSISIIGVTVARVMGTVTVAVVDMPNVGSETVVLTAGAGSMGPVGRVSGAAD